jgi:hypothetical protein
VSRLRITGCRNAEGLPALRLRDNGILRIIAFY